MIFNDRFESLIVNSLRKSGPLDTTRLASVTGLPRLELSRYITSLESEGLISHVKGTIYKLSDELKRELAEGDAGEPGSYASDDEEPLSVEDQEELERELVDAGDEDEDVAPEPVAAPFPGIRKTASVNPANMGRPTVSKQSPRCASFGPSEKRGKRPRRSMGERSPL